MHLVGGGMNLLDLLRTIFGPADDEGELERENELWREAFLAEEVSPEKAWWEDFAQDPHEGSE